MDYILHLLVLVSFYLVVAYSQALITGYLGLLTVSQAAFVAIGAYGAALSQTLLAVPFPLSLVIGALSAATLAAIVYSAFSGLTEEDQVLASLAFQVVVIELLLNLRSLTGGSLGIGGISMPNVTLVAQTWILLAVLIALATTGALAIGRLSRTTIGQRLLLIGEDRVLAEAMGINIARMRLVTIFFAATLAGAAGGAYAYYMTFIEPSSFSLNESVFVLAIVIIGAGRQQYQIATAGFFLIIIPELLRFLVGSSGAAPNVRQLLFGVFLVLAIALRVFSKSKKMLIR